MPGSSPGMTNVGSANLAPQRSASPGVEGALLVRPDADRLVLGDDLDLGRDLDPVVVGIVDEDEQVVAGTMPARAPFDHLMLRGEMVAPVADAVPVLRFEAVVVEAALGRLEDREAMVLVIAAQETRAQDALAVEHAVGDPEADNLGH